MTEHQLSHKRNWRWSREFKKVKWVYLSKDTLSGRAGRQVRSCHPGFLWQPSYAAAAAAAESLQSCPTLCSPIDGSPPGSSIPGILQARTLEWVAISFSSAWKWKVKGKSLIRVWLFATPWIAAYQAPPSVGFSRQEYWSGVPSPSLEYPPKILYYIKHHDMDHPPERGRRMERHTIIELNSRPASGPSIDTHSISYPRKVYISIELVSLKLYHHLFPLGRNIA